MKRIAPKDTYTLCRAVHQKINHTVMVNITTLNSMALKQPVKHHIERSQIYEGLN